MIVRGFPGDSGVKNLPIDAGDTGGVGSIPGSRRSPEGGNGSPLQYSCLEDSVDKSVLGSSPWGCKESDMTEHIHTHGSWSTRL